MDAEGQLVDVSVPVPSGFISYVMMPALIYRISGLTRQPYRQIQPFQCNIKPRSIRWEDLVRDAGIQAQSF
jgi:hypothetical protein